MAVNISEKSSVFTSAKSKYRIMQEENGGIRRFRPLSSSPLPYTVFAPTLFEFDPTKSSSPPDWVMSKLVAIEHCKQVRTKTSFEF